MLTFYPEFEADNITENEIIFLLDLSNSMKVSICQSVSKPSEICISLTQNYLTRTCLVSKIILSPLLCVTSAHNLSNTIFLTLLSCRAML